MSIGIALVCHDGIVIAADTLFEGTSRTYAPKLWGVYLAKATGNLTWAMAGAGLDEHIRLMLRDLQNRTTHLRSFMGVQNAIDATTTKFYEKRVWTMPSQNREDWPQFLIAISQGDRQQLFSVNDSGGLAPVTANSAAIGAGSDLADFLAQTFFRPEAGIVAAQYLAPYIVSQAKRYSRGCGGDTHVARIPKDRRASSMFPEDIVLNETYFEKLFSQAARLAYAGLYPVSHDHMNREIDKFRQAVRQLRVDVHRGEPLGEQLRYLSGSLVNPTARRSPQSPKRGRKRQPPSPG